MKAGAKVCLCGTAKGIARGPPAPTRGWGVGNGSLCPPARVPQAHGARMFFSGIWEMTEVPPTRIALYKETRRCGWREVSVSLVPPALWFGTSEVIQPLPAILVPVLSTAMDAHYGTISVKSWCEFRSQLWQRVKGVTLPCPRCFLAWSRNRTRLVPSHSMLCVRLYVYVAGVFPHYF